MATAYQQPMCH